ncbi:MAG: tRNA pseudouridine(55) synthase TruB [Myxococcales bacterium]|nr:tRNA pseudouridine(55) synthase TruB [Myxococcales bacterium]MDH5306087.1 tRNA pseudouridine(55) synthase TruB [Myxococcales bacterium]MDH5566070.1 tRNA pseudouridine(55) synthase TruB [Myxococcales bacterium]
MTRRRRGRDREAPGPAGFLVVDKPSGWTSHDVVDAARGWLGTRRVGHMGTLDPLATGVLPLAVRAATKLVPFVQNSDKAYRGWIRLGVDTDTLDAEGRVTRRHEGPLPGEAALRAALEAFVGEIEQIPPMFSAVKKGGVPLHKLAREGREVEREPKRVRVERLELLAYDPPMLQIAVDCSMGTYVRVLAADLGARLGCGAHLAELRRTRSGPFDVAQAATPERLAEAAEAGRIDRDLIPALGVLGLPALRLCAEEVMQIRRGAEIPAQEPPLPPGTCMAAHDDAGEVVAILELRPGRCLRPLRVLDSFAGRR